MKFFGLMIAVVMGSVLMSFTPGNQMAESLVGDSTVRQGLFIESAPFTINQVVQSRVAMKGIAGFSKAGRPIEAYYFPGTSNKRALVIGGVHGSELSGIAVAKTLIEQLAKQQDIYYSVIVIPVLFPDNAEKAITNPSLIGGVSNLGRYSYTASADPNRQMPPLGQAFDPNRPLDFAGRPIEPENQLLLQFIQEFQPQRIVNLHAIRDVSQGGIYADPRTDSKGIALGYESDNNLAVAMAQYIESNGGLVPGNKLKKQPTALYHADPGVAMAGQKQKRNLEGSKLPGNRGYGVSLGSWASTAVDDPVNQQYNRPAIRLITAEFPGYKRPADYTDPLVEQQCRKNVELFANAIRKVFLGRFFEE
jgi:hypothetical protein